MFLIKDFSSAAQSESAWVDPDLVQDWAEYLENDMSTTVTTSEDKDWDWVAGWVLDIRNEGKSLKLLLILKLAC